MSLAFRIINMRTRTTSPGFNVVECMDPAHNISQTFTVGMIKTMLTMPNSNPPLKTSFVIRAICSLSFGTKRLWTLVTLFGIIKQLKMQEKWPASFKRFRWQKCCSGCCVKESGGCSSVKGLFFCYRTQLTPLFVLHFLISDLQIFAYTCKVFNMLLCLLLCYCTTKIASFFFFVG